MNYRILQLFLLLVLGWAPVQATAQSGLAAQSPVKYTGIARPDTYKGDYVWSDIFKLPSAVNAWSNSDLADVGFTVTYTTSDPDGRLVVVENCGFDASLPYRNNQFRFHINPFEHGTVVLTLTAHYQGEEATNTITVSVDACGENPLTARDKITLYNVGGPVKTSASQITNYVTDFFNVPSGWSNIALWEELGMTIGAETDNEEMVAGLAAAVEELSSGNYFATIRYTLNPVVGDAYIKVWTERNGERREAVYNFSQYYVQASDDAMHGAFADTLRTDILQNDNMMEAPYTIEMVREPQMGSVEFVNTSTSWRKACEARYVFSGPADTPNWSNDTFRYRLSVWNSDQTEVVGSAEAEVTVTLRHNPAPSSLHGYLPAPGQFTNNYINGSSMVGAWGNMSGNGLESKQGSVSLGSFGGYIELGFEHSIYNDPRNPYGVDFQIGGNAFAAQEKGHWTEPAAVMVMRDDNGNGLPDDTWYELAGSEYWWSDTQRNITMTYSDPGYVVAHDVPFETSTGRRGSILWNTFHRQPYFPQASSYPDAAGNDGTLTYPGTEITGVYDRRNPSYIEGMRALAFGYADNHANVDNNAYIARNPYYADERGAVADGFDISWAVDAEGNYVDLDRIDFIRIYTAVSENCGQLGEASAELSYVCATQPEEGITGNEEYWINWAHYNRLQVLVGESVDFEGFAFRNGRPQRDLGAHWTSTEPTVGTITEGGTFTGLAEGKTKLTFRATDLAPADTLEIEVVTLSDMLIVNGNGAELQEVEVYVGETYMLHAESVTRSEETINDGKENRYVYDRYTWTSLNPDIVAVEADGYFTAIGEGEAIVTATSKTNGALSKAVTIKVSALPEVKLIANYLTFDQSSWTTQEALNKLTVAQNRIFETGGKRLDALTLLETLPVGHDDKFIITADMALGNKLIKDDYREYLLTFETTFSGVTQEHRVPVLHMPSNNVPVPSIGEGKVEIHPTHLSGSLDLAEVFVMETLVPEIYTREFALDNATLPEGVEASVEGSVLTVSVSDLELVGDDLTVPVKSRISRVRAQASAPAHENSFEYQNTWKKAAIPVVVKDITAISSVEAEGTIRIFPNPAAYAFTLNISEPTSLEIYTAGGVRLASLPLEPGQAVDISKLSAGIYIVVLPESRTTLRLIKE